MRFIHIENPGPRSKLHLMEGPMPSYNESQILVEVHATALNRADLLQRKGKYPPPSGETKVPGLELAGVVLEVGSQVTKFKPGDKIYGLVAGGAYADYCVVEDTLAQLMPTHYSWSMAAALPEALITAYSTLFDLGALKAQQTVLIHGAGSGITSFAIQMAKLHKAHVITSVGSDDKIAKAKDLGDPEVFNHQQVGLLDFIKSDSLNLIIDFIGGDYFNQHLQLLCEKGKLIQIACMKGNNISCDLAFILRKRLQINGFILRSQTVEEKSRLWQLAHLHCLDSLKTDQLKPIIDSVFPLEKIEEAHRYMQAGKHFGKIIITMKKN